VDFRKGHRELCSGAERHPRRTATGELARPRLLDFEANLRSLGRREPGMVAERRVSHMTKE